MAQDEKKSQIKTSALLYIWSLLLMTQIIYLALAFQKSQVTALSETRLPNVYELGELLPALAALAALAAAWFVPRKLIKTLLPAAVFRYACFECVTVLGLIVALIAGDGTKIIPYFAVALCGMVLSFPKAGQTSPPN